MSIFSEIETAVRGMHFNKEHEKEKMVLLAKYKDKMEQLDKMVGEKPWVLGYLTWVDFEVAEKSHYFQSLFPEAYKMWPFLQRIRENFDALPETKAYYERADAIKEKFYPSFAQVKVTL